MKHKEKHSPMAHAFHRSLKEHEKKMKNHELYHAPNIKSAGPTMRNSESKQEEVEFNLINEDRSAPSNLPIEGSITRIPNFGQPPVHAAPYSNMFIAHIGNNEYDHEI